jgi:hypothetical protein
MTTTHASRLSDTELISTVARLAGGEREATVALIAHLAEFDARRLFEGLGFPSTFKYCLTALRLSEDAAFNRIEAARAARRHPVVLDMLESGALSPTTARMLGRHLTSENHEELLEAASGRSKSEVEELLAARFPPSNVRSSIRPLGSEPPAPISTAPEVAVASGVGRDVPSGCDAATPATPPGVDASPVVVPAAMSPRPALPPPSASRYEIRFTASAETREKMRLALDLLGHAVPTGDLGQVFDRALTLLVEDLQRKKFAATGKPRASRGQSDDSRNIPAAVRRAVVARDGGRCAFVAGDGRRCDARRFLEFHHLRPYATAGKPTVDNIALRCRAHNRYEAALFYGPARRYAAGERADEGITTDGSGSRCSRSGTGDGSGSRATRPGTGKTGPRVEPRNPPSP